jgi:hypothetical protein
MRKIHRFSQGGALEMQKQGKRGGPWAMASHALGRFLKSYILKRGFLDGTEGLIIAFMEADHAFLKYAKLWELENSRARPPAPSPPAPPGATR